jgi:glycosyltransferase involved in cell wall biosynthesis
VADGVEQVQTLGASAPGVSLIDGLAVSTIPTLRQIVKAEEARPKKKVVFCTPTLSKPHPAFIESLKASIPLIVEAGWDEGATWQIGCAYISAARAMMTRRALDVKADVIVYLDHDMSWDPPDLLRLIETEGDVVAGTYRFKYEPVEYMGRPFLGPNGHPMCREDGCVHMVCVPAGFLKVTRQAINKIIRAHPELCFGEESAPIIDLFQHGAHKGLWFGEDYAFCRRWNEMQEQVWVIPDLNIVHHDKDVAFPGNYHRYLTELAQSEPDHAHV